MAKFKIMAALCALLLVLAIPHVSKAQSYQDQNGTTQSGNQSMGQSGTSQGDQTGTSSSSSSSSSSSMNQNGINDQSNQSNVSRKLPRTASNLPLIGLSGLIALGMGAGLSLALKK